MTIGIYRLNFNGTNKCYIGQSEHSIESRFTAHIRAMKSNFAAKKLQTAYDTYGEPTLEILIEALPEELDDLEIEAIQVYDSINNGFNTLTGGSTGNGQYGEAVSNALYTNDVYRNILKMLASGMSKKDIHKELNVNISVVTSIKTCENHKWLKQVLPEEYDIVEKEHLNYSPKNNHAQARGISYVPIIEISTGKRYEIISLRETARILNMDSGNLSRLLNGQVDSYKGFMLETNINKSKAKLVKDPKGKIHEIPYRGLSTFATQHGMVKSMLSNLLNKKRSEYNGWTLP